MLASKGGSWANSTFVKTTLPMFGFVVFAWLGLSQLMESKLRIRVRGSSCCRCCQTAATTPKAAAQGS